MKYLTYTPTCGDSIFNAAEGAIKMSRTKYYYTYREVRFKFNDVEIIVLEDDTIQGISNRYTDSINANRLAYKKTPEYKKQKIRSAIKFKETQIEHDKLMAQLYEVTSEAEVLDWLYKYVPLVDNIELKSDKSLVKDHLIKLGYIQGDNLGQDKDFYNDKTNFARYIIGQVMNCWHPMCVIFIEQYRKMENKTLTGNN